MKLSQFPCPLDQIPIICFKRCPFLRSFVMAVCDEVIKTKIFPKQWLKATTILIYKKGDRSDPSNYRPITLEPVMLKIFTSLLRDRVFEFLSANGSIETNLQKGFTPGLAGTYEHIASMSHLIKDARRKQKSITITLIDLKNAFREVNHKLIETVLEHHHLPNDVIELVRNLYSNFYVTIITDSYCSDFVKVSKGVLQGDCFSPLVFNMLINTFVQYVKNDHFT